MRRFVANEPAQRVDRFLSDLLPDRSRSFFKAEIEDGRITINGKRVKPSAPVFAGDEIVWDEPEAVPWHLEAEPIELCVLYEDDDLIVVDKPRGMVVHPAPGHRSGTLVHALLHHTKGNLSTINGVIRPGIIHRIDKDTSGVLLVVKNDFSHRKMAEAIRKREITRRYEALASGVPETTLGTIDAPIGRDLRDRMKRAVIEGGKEAVTHFEVIRAFPGTSHLKVELETGRTHQIRVHLAFIGHAILGDLLYGGPPVEEIDGQALHAASLSFKHPRSGEVITVESRLPDDFRSLLKRLES